MKRLVGCFVALSAVAIAQSIALADIGGRTFLDFQRSCYRSGGTFETWYNRELGTCVYPGAGSTEEWFWASQENLENTLDTYKSGGAFRNRSQARRNLVMELRLRAEDRDRRTRNNMGL